VAARRSSRWFVIDAVAALELRPFYAAYRDNGQGRAAHDPAMMVAQEGLQPALRERMLAGAETLFDVELGSYESFLPDDETLAAIVAPVMVLVSEQSLAVYARLAGSPSVSASR
jgi:hypothetical protein